MMLMQSQAVADVLLGRDAGWQVQRRDDGSLTMRELIGRFGKLTLIGILMGVSAYAVSWSLFLWMSPVTIGLLLAMPLAALTARSRAGIRLRKLHLLLIPEERQPPQVLVRANELAAAHPDESAQVGTLLRSARLRQAHADMLTPLPPHRRGKVDHDLVLAKAKLDEADTVDEAVGFLAANELRALLTDPDGFALLLGKQAAAAPRTVATSVV
jgi:membrane glycosyltransferase